MKISLLGIYRPERVDKAVGHLEKIQSNLIRVNTGSPLTRRANLSEITLQCAIVVSYYTLHLF